MIGMPRLADVVAVLAQDGLITEPSAVFDAQTALAADPNERPLPWYMRLLVTLGGWLTAFFMLFWLTFGIVCTAGVESGAVVMVVSALVGLPALAVSMGVVWGPALYEQADQQRWAAEGEEVPERGFAQLFARTVAIDFFGQVGVAGVLAAQGGFAAGALMLTDSPIAVLVLLLAQSALLMSNPHYVLRFTSAGMAGAWGLLLFDELGLDDAMGSVVVVALGGVSLVWLARRWSAHTRAWRLAQPVAHGLGAFVMAVGFLIPEMDDLGLVPAGFAAVAIGVAGWVLGERRAWLWMGVVLPAVLVVAVATSAVPAVVAAMVLAVLGVRVRDRVTLGMGVAGLLVYGLYFWTVVGLDGLERSAVLGVLGLVGVGIAALIAWRRRDPAAQVEPISPARVRWVGGGVALVLVAAVAEMWRVGGV